ncbi:MAG: hypothetical protein HUU02_00450 [Bacteroidetes bacterium]|nr:hypothetical protein [Bacteroidota bacterium]
MRFARNVFSFAGSYGIVVTLPLYFSEARIGIDQPPAITHPEYFYGFIGVTLAWQVLFLMVARDVQRYRMMMLPAILEKFSYAAAGGALFAMGRIGQTVAAFAAVDLLFGILFIRAFLLTREPVPFRP